MIETRVGGRLVERLDAGRARHQTEMVWIDAVEPDAAEVDYLARALQLHPLAVEDLENRNQRPKVDQYGDDLFTVIFGACRNGESGQRIGESLRLAEVHVVVGDNVVASISDTEVPSLRALFQQCERRPEICTGGSGMLFHRICDALVDSFFPVLDELDDAIDRLETSIIETADESTIHDVFALKRELNILRRVLSPERDLLQALAGPHGPRLGAEAQLYLRDVYDHAVRIVEQVDAYRDIVTGALDVYLSSVSNRLGEQTRRLSMVATIFLPLSFFTGFFGQNFGALVDRITGVKAFVIGECVMAASVVAIWLVVRGATAGVRPVPAERPRRPRRRLFLPTYTRASAGGAEKAKEA